MNKEVWSQVNGYNNIYEISNYGNVRSVDRIVNAKNGSTRIVKGKYVKLIFNGLYYVLGNQKTAYGYIWLDKLKELKEGKK